jgi:hypothetical protein
MGKTGVPEQGILTSNAVSLNLKICIYIYVEHKYPERLCLNKRTSSYLTFLGLKECQHRLIPEKGGGIPFLLFCDNDQYIDNVFSFLLKNITGVCIRPFIKVTVF